VSESDSQMTEAKYHLGVGVAKRVETERKDRNRKWKEYIL
jgi:hypothetical protein